MLTHVASQNIDMKILSYLDSGYAPFVRRLNRRALPEPGTRDLVSQIIAEVAAAHLAMENLDDVALDRLTELSAIGYDPDDHESLLTYVGVNAEFHDIIAGASGNRRLADLVSRLVMESSRFIQVAVLSEEHGRQVSEQHVAIINALRERDADAVASTIRAHVEGRLNVTLECFLAGVTHSSSNGSH